MDTPTKNIETPYQDYIFRSGKLSDNYTAAIVLFGFIEIATVIASFFLGTTIPGYIVFVFVGLFFILLFYYFIYNAERKYRKITASYGYFIKKSPVSMFVLVLSVIYYITISYPIISMFFAQETPVVISAAVFILLFTLIFSNPWARVPRNEVSRIESESLLEKLKASSESSGMKFIDPKVFPGTKMKVANAFCTGLFHPRVYISDYLVQNLDEEEILSVLLHEYGHARYHHILKLTIPLVVLYLFILITTVYTYLQPDLFLLQGYLTLSIFLQYPFFFYKRWLELRADQFAAKMSGAEKVSKTLAKITMMNLVLPNRGSFTHPSLEFRQQRLTKLERKGKVPS